MRKNRFICAIMAVFYLMQLIAIPAFAAEKKYSNNVAYIYFSAKPEKKNIAIARMGLEEDPIISERDGEVCWLMDVLKGDKSKYIYLSLSQGFADTTGTATYDIEVDYYDYGQGYFTVWYDSETNENKYQGIYDFKDERVWKTAKFTLDDAAFQKRLDGKYDIRLDMTIPESKRSKKSANSVAIKRVQITRNDNKNPIYVDSTIDEAGAAFRWYSEEKIIHDHFENRTDEALTVNVRRVAVAEESKAILFDETEELTFSPREKRTVDFDIGKRDKCEQYEYKIYITSKEHGINSEFTPIRFAVMKSDPNGIKFAPVYMNTFLFQTENYMDLVDIIDKSNIAGVRENNAWWSIEQSSLQKGEYYFDGMRKGSVEALAQRGVKVMPLITSMSFHYSRNNNNFPSTPEQLEGWRKYVRFLAEKYAQYGTKVFEIWNEPDIGDNNSILLDDGVSYKTGAAYVPVYNIAKEEIKAVIPDALVLGPGVCGGSTGQQFVDEALEAGWAETVEGISSHPYTRSTEETAGTLSYVEYFKEQVAKYGGKEDIPYWTTEIGVTCADKEVATLENKGNWDARRTYYLPATGEVLGLTLFAFEGRGLVPYDREDNFQNTALSTADLYQNTNPFMPFPSLLKITASCYVLGDSTPTETIYKGANYNLCEYKSNKFNADVLAMNTINKGASPYETLTLKLGCDKLDYYDEYGNMTTVYGDKGVYTFTLDERPSYIVGNFDSVEIIEDDIISYSNNVIDSSNNDVTAFTIKKPSDKNYTVSVDCNYGLELVKNDGFVGNEAEVRIRVSGEKGTYSFATVKIMEGDKVIQQSQVRIYVKDLVVPSINVVPVNTDNFNKWTGEVLLFNTSAEYAAKGKLKFTYPEMLAAMPAMDIGTIPRQRTGRVKFNLPDIIEKGNYTAEYEVDFENGEKVIGLSNFDFTVAAKAKRVPVIDGVIEEGEWRTDTAMYLNDATQTRNLIASEPWKGPEDLSAKMVVEWDEENMYFMAEVQDDEYFYQEPIDGMYRDDNIQFGIFYGEQGYIAAGQGATTFHEINLGHATDGLKAYRSRSQDDSYPNGELENYELGITREGEKTYYEFKIPWKNLLREGDQPEAGNKLGFSALVNENDGTGRRGWIEYASGIGAQKNTALFTYITLYE